MSKDIVSIEFERKDIEMLYSILLKARASELSEEQRVNRLHAAYNDRDWANLAQPVSRVPFLTQLIEQVKSVR